MSDDIKRMDIAEFQREGYLQEVNRLVLHPLGLALEVVIDEEGTRLGGVWDYRDDPEGIAFDGVDLQPNAKHVEELLAERIEARMDALGYVIQPYDA